MTRILATLGLAAMTAAPAFAQTPNVLLLIADDVGVDGIGCYGYPNAAPTPHIDALAAQGVKFDNAHVCPACSPTRATLMTGRYGFRTGIGRPIGGQGAEGLPASEVILPEILPANITTALIGKWHLGSNLGPLTPTAEGFDVFTGMLQGSVPSYYQWTKVQNGLAGPETNYTTTELVDDALLLIGSTTTPWFLVMSFNAAHSPFEAPPAALHTQNLGGLNPTITPTPFYKAMVEAMDTEIGRLLAGIPAATLANTTVFFLGDNGTANQVVEPPFDPQRSKGTVYQGGVRVPFIATGHGVSGTPRTEAGLVHSVDLFHTIAALQGVDARAAVPASVPLDGVDFTSLLAAGGQPGVRATVFSEEFAGSAPMSSNGDSEVIRNDRFELLRFRAQNTVREEMYDLQSDPWETTDLLLQPLSAAATDAYRDLWRALAGLRGLPVAVPFGAGCSGGGHSPVLRAINDPAIGTTFNMRVTGLSASVTAVFGTIGFDDDDWLGTPLPWDLTAVGMTGCSLLVDPLFTRLLPQTTMAAPWNEALPNDPSYIGLEFYVQAFVGLPGANAGGALATRALLVIVGS